jgi:redox-sensitive bicupin YhaK (pirin superfamily)
MTMIIKQYTPQQTMEGAGVIVNRVFGYHDTREFDPFLMLDYFDVHMEPVQSYESPGFPCCGSIVMNTQKELIETFRDLENNRFAEDSREE